MTAPYWSDDQVTLYLGKAERVLPTLPDACVDAIVTDPPAGVAFMNKSWDHDRGGRDQWVAWLTEVLTEATRCLKPGGHALIWALPRTSHWTAWAIEDAGLTIRDCVTHLFGNGFPKTLDVGRAIDKGAGAERPVTGVAADFARDGFSRKTDGSHVIPHERQGGHGFTDRWASPVTVPGTPEAARWDGWGTALKPASEHWWLARKPFKGTVAGNVLQHGTGALNIDGCRVQGSAGNGHWHNRRSVNEVYGQASGGAEERHESGRWPTNTVFSHLRECGPDDTTPCAEGCPVLALDRQSGVTTSSGGRGTRSGKTGQQTYGEWSGAVVGQNAGGLGDSGGASRFFPVFRYQAKAPASERPKVAGVAHETVKPLALIRWLTRLITPPGGTVLDPFLGSGTTAEACVHEGMRCVGIEEADKYMPLIQARLTKPAQTGLDLGEVIA